MLDPRLLREIQALRGFVTCDCRLHAMISRDRYPQSSNWRLPFPRLLYRIFSQGCCRYPSLDRRAQRTTALPAKPGARSIVESAFRAARHRLKRRAAVVAEFQSLGIFGSAMSTVISPSRSTTQFVEQRLGVLEIGGVEAFGEPGVDFHQHCMPLVAPAVLCEHAREARRCAQFPGFRAHVTRERDSLAEAGLGQFGLTQF